MIAAGFNTIEGKVPNPEMTNAIRAEPLSSGLFLLTSGVYGKVIRFRVPLTIPDDVVAEALDILEASIDAVKGAWNEETDVSASKGVEPSGNPRPFEWCLDRRQQHLLWV